MNEIDLIPANYRPLLRLKRVSRRFVVGLLVLLLSLAVGKGWMAQALQTERMEIERLRKGEVLLLDRKNRYEESQRLHADLSRRLQALDALRNGPAAEKLFEAVDRSLNSGVWLTEWTFLRDGDVSPPPPATSQVGYLLVVTEPEEAQKEESWLVRSRMEIHGQALSHSDLADFMRTLEQQSVVRDVQLLNTKTRRYTSTQVIEYQLIAEIDAGRKSP